MAEEIQENQEEVIEEKCPCCGASMKKHWHRLSAGLATVLVKFRAAVIAKGVNDLHIPKEVTFTKTEYNNFQKLRYHALIAKVRDEKGNHLGGHWLLTRRGNLFCKNQIKIPAKVQTFRNRISEKSEQLIDILDVLTPDDDLKPFWDAKEDMEYDLFPIDISDLEPPKDKAGQGLLFMPA